MRLGGDYKNGALHSGFMFVNIKPYKSNKMYHIFYYQNIATLVNLVPSSDQ